MNIDDWMAQACQVGPLRGRDGTGFFQIGQGPKPRTDLFKLPLSGEFVAGQKRALKIFSRVKEAAITVGHHRAATYGEVNVDNCHPFEHVLDVNDDRGKVNNARIMGVHNGTITGHNRKEDDIEFDVDSDWAMYKILKEGPEKAISRFRGSFNFVWWDNITNQLHMFTNGARSLCFAPIKGHNVVLFASEDRMLYWLAGRNGIELSKIVVPVKDSLYSFDPTENLMNYDVTKIEPYVAPVVVSDFRGKAAPNSYFNPVVTAAREKFRGTEVEFFPDAGPLVWAGPTTTIRGSVLLNDSDTLPAVINTVPGVMEANIRAGNTIRCMCVHVVGLTTSVGGYPIGTPELQLTHPHFIEVANGEVVVNTPPIQIPLIGETSRMTARGPGGTYLTAPQWHNAKISCVGCNKDVKFVEGIRIVNPVMWINDGKDCLCNECQSDNIVLSDPSIQSQVHGKDPRGPGYENEIGPDAWHYGNGV